MTDLLVADTTMITPLLLNPKHRDYAELDPASQRILRATIDFFEAKGKAWLKQQAHDRVWYTEFLDLLKEEQIFALLGTPASHGDGDDEKQWNTARITAWNEVAGFYGAQYCYPWGVTSLASQVIFQSDNEAAKQKAVAELARGGIFGFGLSEKTHGADIYSTDCLITPNPSGGFTVTGSKYYCGNGNVARIIPTFGRRTDIEGEDAYVFFLIDSRHPAYTLRGNVINAQYFVSSFDIVDYPITENDILHTGKAAFQAALNAVNVGKFNLGAAAIGICTHSFYETINHAENRVLFGNRVTEFGQVKQILVDSYSRLITMKLFTERAVDYMRSATPEDRRYVMFNPIAKALVTRDGERIMTALLDVMSARGLERDTYFEMGADIISALPRVEGTVHVNMALILKFLPSYLFNPSTDVPVVGKRKDAADDTFLFNQGSAKGLSKTRFAPWRAAYERYAHVPNVARFLEQADGFANLFVAAPPSAEQQQDMDFQLAVADLFTLLPYGQLILEEAALRNLDDDLIDQVFNLLVREFSGYATTLHGKTTSTDAQQDWALAHVRKPVRNDESTARIYAEIRALAGAYEMNT